MDAPLSRQPAALRPFWAAQVGGLICAVLAAPWAVFFTIGTLAGSWQPLPGILLWIVPTAYLMGVALSLVGRLLRVRFWLPWLGGAYAFPLGLIAALFAFSLIYGPNLQDQPRLSLLFTLTVAVFIFGVAFGSIPPFVGAVLSYLRHLIQPRLKRLEKLADS